jgi:hypothetical protein
MNAWHWGDDANTEQHVGTPGECGIRNCTAPRPEDDYLANIEATSRRLAAKAGLSTHADVYGDHCTNCDARWALPADKASCSHKPICEDCYPNGCDTCEREIEDGIRHREHATNRIISAALELRTNADDLSETDLAKLGHIARKDVARSVSLTIEALRRVEDVLRAHTAGASK